MEPWLERLRMLEDNDRYQASQLVELKIMASSTQQLVILSEKRFDKIEKSVELLTEIANRWKGILLAALVLGPAIGGILTMLVRVMLFGEPLSHGGGLLHP